MRIGMYLEMKNPPAWKRPWPQHYGRWLERIAEADRLGADAVWLTEHHFFDDGYLPQCWTLAAAIVARTKSMRIGSAVTLLPLHPSIDLAEQIALVDVISGGRAEPGFGVGYRKSEYIGYGCDFNHRYDEFAKRIHQLRRFWGEEPGAATTVTPGPIQQPLPMWAGFGGPKGARTAGQLGLGLLSIDPALLEPYREGLAAGGRDPSTARMANHVELFLTDDPERAWAQIEAHVVYRWRSLNRYMFGLKESEAEDVTHPYFEKEAILKRVLLGTPEQVAATLREHIGDLPVTDLYLFSDFPGLPDELIDQNLELAFTRLAPLLRQGA